MKKLLTLVALLTIGVWFAGCGETPPAKAPAKPAVESGPADKAADADKAPAGEAKPAEEKPADAVPAEEKKPE
ncbi:MAG TPA: hypothetical protein VL475_02075 [Planctomycetaceae bacterium]|nr:hypothetical protein [Planctomycetaceae bacterium]